MTSVFLHRCVTDTSDLTFPLKIANSYFRNHSTTYADQPIFRVIRVTRM